MKTDQARLLARLTHKALVAATALCVVILSMLANAIPAQAAEGSVTGTVFRDYNSSGAFEVTGTPVEVGVAGVKVTALDSDGKVAGSSQTDTDGTYTIDFNTTTADTEVRVEFDVPTDYVVTRAGIRGATSGTDLQFVSDGDLADLGIAQPDDYADTVQGAGSAVEIGNRVWLDQDHDGIQDAAEQGIGGVAVSLRDSADKLLASTTTAANGTYYFNDGNVEGDVQRSADYTIRFDRTGPLAGLVNTWGTESHAVDVDGEPQISVTTRAAGSDHGADAGFSSPYFRIGGEVWLDQGDGSGKGDSRNGRLDPDEPGTRGVTVGLFEQGTPVTTAVTDADGRYVFNDLTAGTYAVRFSNVPAGLRFTQPGAGNDAKNSDADPTTGETAPTILDSENPSNLEIHAGLIEQRYAIGDYAWTDSDRDGVQDLGEAPAPGVTVELLDSEGARIAEVETDPDGSYRFDDLRAGNYRVRSTPRDDTSVVTNPWVGTDPATDSDAGSGGLSQLITLGPDAANLRPIRASDELTADLVNSTVDVGLVDNNQRFAVGDHVWIDLDQDGVQGPDDKPITGVNVELHNGDDGGALVATTTTDANGGYVFDDLDAGTYVVKIPDIADDMQFTATRAGSDPDVDSDIEQQGDNSTGAFRLGADADSVRPATADDGVSAGFINPTVDAGMIYLDERVIVIGDYFWYDQNSNGIQDADESGLEGITVELLDANGEVVGTTSTNEEGRYRFFDEAPGTYSVRFSYNFDEFNDYLAFTKRGAGSDRSVDSNADPKTGLTKAFSVNSDNFGDLSIDAALTVNINFEAYNVGDRVWYDDNRNGNQDKGEKPVEGVVVELLAPDGEVLDDAETDDHGQYLFEYLPTGSYAVRFSQLPAGYIFTTEGKNNTDNDSNPASSGMTQQFTLAPGEPNMVATNSDDEYLPGYVNLSIDAGIVTRKLPPKSPGPPLRPPGPDLLPDTGSDVPIWFVVGGVLVVAVGGGLIFLGRKRAGKRVG